MEEQQVYGEYNGKYIFAQNNPYLGVAFPVPLAV